MMIHYSAETTHHFRLILLVILFLIVGCQSAASQPASELDSAESTQSSASLEVGEAVYAANCASCHGVNLEGQTNWQTPNEDGTWKAPPHDETGHTWHHPDAYILDRINNGTEGLDPGMQANSNMPAYKETLSAAEIEAVLEFIKRSWPEDVQAAQAARSQ